MVHEIHREVVENVLVQWCGGAAAEVIHVSYQRCAEVPQPDVIHQDARR